MELSVIWNGKSWTNYSQRGLKQGDPLSPYLFVLCMEVLGQNIQKAVTDGRWKSVKAYKDIPGVSHIFFADDLILFGEGWLRQPSIMASIIKEFFYASGQKINTHKLEMLVSRNTA